jgi:hypothetical protein
MRGPNTRDTLTLPVGNYMSGTLGNYVSENPSDLRNFMSADSQSRYLMYAHIGGTERAPQHVGTGSQSASNGQCLSL